MSFPSAGSSVRSQPTENSATVESLAQIALVVTTKLYPLFSFCSDLQRADRFDRIYGNEVDSSVYYWHWTLAAERYVLSSIANPFAEPGSSSWAGIGMSAL